MGGVENAGDPGNKSKQSMLRMSLAVPKPHTRSPSASWPEEDSDCFRYDTLPQKCQVKELRRDLLTGSIGRE